MRDIFNIINNTLISNKTKNETSIKHENLFLLMVILIVGISVIFSIFKTKFNTILLFFPLLLIGLFPVRKFSFPKLPSYIIIIECIIFFTLILILLFFLRFGEDHIGSDFYYYSKISISLRNLGKENLLIFYNDLQNINFGSQPYHYLDIWISAVFAQILGINDYIMLRFVSPAIFTTLIYIGFRGLFQNKVYLIVALIIFLLLHFDPFLITKNIMGQLYYSNILFRQNLIFFYLSILLTWIGFNKKSLMIILFGSIVGITSSHLHLPFYILLFLGILIIMTRDFKRITIIKYLLSFSLFLAFYTFFYKIQSKPIELTGVKFTNFNSFSEIKVLLGSFISYFIPLVIFSTFIVFFSFKKFKELALYTKLFLIILFLICIFQILAYALLFKTDNSYQFLFLAFSGILFSFLILIQKEVIHPLLLILTLILFFDFTKVYKGIGKYSSKFETDKINSFADFLNLSPNVPENVGFYLTQRRMFNNYSGLNFHLVYPVKTPLNYEYVNINFYPLIPLKNYESVKNSIHEDKIYNFQSLLEFNYGPFDDPFENQLVKEKNITKFVSDSLFFKSNFNVKKVDDLYLYKRKKPF
jgi:hypothetical protein